MKSTIETLEGNKVKLSIELEEAEFDREIDAAFRKIAKEIRLPGFRPGKAPRQVVEARIGKDAARTQAIQDAIPEYLSRAVREHDVDIIATPDVELKEGQEAGVVKFDATCEIRPEITVPGYTGLRIELPSPEVTDENLEEVILGERRRHGVLTDIDRAAGGDRAHRGQHLRQDRVQSAAVVFEVAGAVAEATAPRDKAGRADHDLEHEAVLRPLVDLP